jgi:hypothetical protein
MMYRPYNSSRQTVLSGRLRRADDSIMRYLGQSPNPESPHLRAPGIRFHCRIAANSYIRFMPFGST